MAEPRRLGPALHIIAEAVGSPGQRRFRLHMMNDAGTTAALWLEKEQLLALGEAMQTVLKGEGYEYAPLPLDDRGETPVFPLDPDIEFRIGQLSMGLHRDAQRIVLNGAEAAVDDDEPEGISIELDYRQSSELGHQIVNVAAAGRPPCPLCGGPLDPQGHICPKSNGHHAQT